jgi:hypothetical protein
MGKVADTQAECKGEFKLCSSMPSQGQTARLIYKYTIHEERGKVVAW